MRGKCVCLLSLLASGTLLLGACAQTPTATTSAPATSASPVSTTAASVSVPSAETPKYGGTLACYMGDPAGGFDEAYNMGHVGGMVTTPYLTNEQLLEGDWKKGPAGSHDQDWSMGFIGRSELLTGCLAESWEFPDETTIIFHIRKGVRWQNKPPVNGRELTADDIVFNINRNWTSTGSYLFMVYPAQYRPTSVKAVDKYTVEIKVPLIMHGQMFLVMGDFMTNYPPDMIAKFGDMRDWKNACGTGPWMLTDFVAGSSQTYARNPNYWKKDPFHPQNQLPYIDAIKAFNIPDASTRFSALRTGKLDKLGGADSVITSDDAESIMKTAPQLQQTQWLSSPAVPVGRMDKQDLPFKDIKVRQALNMAINREALVKDYYKGHATLFAMPYPPTPAYSKIFTPLEQQSQEVQDLFTYNPTRAKKLLADAGYPNGFKTVIDCTQADVDFLSIIRENFLAINVDMQINPLEQTVNTAQQRARANKEMTFKGQIMDYQYPWRMLMLRIESADNNAYVSDPSFRAPYEEICQKVGYDDARVNAILKEVAKQSLATAYGVWLPAYEAYTFWWPWVQNSYGAWGWGGYFTPNDQLQYVWLDQSLKKSTGY
jgi:peptide/nickel transport system substrate-binding protein